MGYSALSMNKYVVISQPMFFPWAGMLEQLRLEDTEISIVELMHKDSLHMTDDDRASVVRAVRAAGADKPPTTATVGSGIVVLHGTATLEETAYALNLTAKVQIPIVVVGAQRPASALSTDAGLNLVNAERTAACPEARGLGVLVCLNDEIQAAREVTKTSTARLQTFRSPDFGALGHADGDAVNFYRKPIRRGAPDRSR